MRGAPKTDSQTNGLWAARKCIELDAEVTSYVDLSDLDNLHLGMAVAGGVWTMVVYETVWLWDWRRKDNSFFS